jgi:hypothetical protein
MKWGAFQDYAADLVMFAGLSDQTLICLLGSIHSLVGWTDNKDANHSIDYYALKYFDSLTGEHNIWGSRVGPDEKELRDRQDEIVEETRRIHKVLEELKTPPRNVEFVARRIAMKTQDSATLLVGSPLYVALSD